MKKSVYQKFSIVFLVGGIFCLCARAFALPTELHWEFAGYGGGGAFPYIYPDLSVQDKVWLISDVAGIFESVNDGDSWSVLPGDTLGNVGGDTIVQSPSNPSVFYHASGRTTGAGAVHKSVDGGRTWTTQGTGSNFLVNINGHKALAVKRDNPNIAYLGNANGDIYRTTDGATWSLWLPAAGLGLGRINALIVDRTNIYLWAGSDTGLRRIAMADGTITVPAPLSGTNQNQNRDLAAVTINGINYIFVTAGTRIAYTTDSGATWTASADTNIGSAHCINRMAIAPGSTLATTKIMIATTTTGFSYNGTRFLSSNGGLSWSSAAGTIRYNSSDNPTRSWHTGWGLTLSLAADPNNPNRWYGTDFWGVYRSDDNGSTWDEKVRGAGNTVVSDIRIAPDNSIYMAMMDNGLVRSTDGGLSWTMLIPNATAGQGYPQVAGHVWKVVCLGTAAEWAAGNGVVVATNYSWDGAKKHQILRGTNQGGAPSNAGTWTVESSVGIPNIDLAYGVWGNGYARAISLDPNATGSADGRIWVGLDGYNGTTNGGVFLSTDGGRTFTRKTSNAARACNSSPRSEANDCGNSIRVYNGLAVNAADATNICYGSFAAGIFCSTDSGRTWRAPAQGNLYATYDIKSGPDGTLYAVGDASGPALARSMDKGASWTMIWHGRETSGPADGLEVDPSNKDRLVVSSTSYNSVAPNHIFMTENATDPVPVFTDITGDLPSGQGMATCAFRNSEGTSGYLYGGRYGGSVWKLNLGSPDTAPPSAPANLRFALSGSHVLLSWTASTDDVGVAGYEVFSGTAPIGTTTQTAYTTASLVAGVIYHYTVKSFDASGNMSAPSRTVTVDGFSGLETPANLAATVIGSGVHLSWTPSANAFGYNVYRNHAYLASYATTNVVDASAVRGATYTYGVQAYDASSFLSSISSPVTITVLDTTAPSAPAQLTAALSGSRINLAWTASTDNVGVAQYQIFNGASLLGTGTLTTFVHNNVAPGATYAYSVKAMDAAGNVSEASNTVEGISGLTAPTDLEASVRWNGVHLSWAPSTSAAGYNVCRNDIYLASFGTTDVMDTTAVKGSVYTYKVQAYDGSGRLSDFSNSVTVTP